MTLPFDAYQTAMLLALAATILAGYFHVKFQTGQNAKELSSHEVETVTAMANFRAEVAHEVAKIVNDTGELSRRVAALELANAAQAGTIATIENFKEALGEMKHELKNQRTITMQLERIVARMDGANNPTHPGDMK